jgi:chaperonin GroEL
MPLLYKDAYSNISILFNSLQDGVTVAKAIEFKDRFQNMGAQLVRQVASKTNDVAGDGTTTATVLARAIFSEGCKSVAAGLNPMDLRRGMTQAVDLVISNLKSQAVAISSSEEIAQVGTISANGDREVGDLLAKAMEKVGKEGVITVQDGRTLHDELETVEGMKFDRGYISPYFVNDAKTQKVEFEDCYILLVEKKVSSLQSILHLLEAIVRENKPLVILAEDVESEALASLVLNKLRAGLKVCAVKAPGFGDNRKANLQDIAELTGGTVISEEVGMKLETATLDHLGRARKLTISKDDTLILGGMGSKEAIAERCEMIRDLAKNTTSEYEKEKLEERLAKLSGGIAVIKVGGGSEVEMGEKKDRIVDALNATRAAVQEGIVPGGGVALLNASKVLDDLAAKATNQDVRVGIEIIQRAIRRPLTTIASNAGVPGEVIVGKLLESSNPRWGYNAATGQYVDMISAGIIDPVKVVRTALQDASSVAALMTTSEVAVADLPEEKSAAAAPPMGAGGMGGMGGMF